MKTIEIPLSKRKLSLLLLGAIVFVGLGVWMQFQAMHPVTSGNSLFRQPIILRAVGMISIVFFGICGIFAIKKMRDKSPGLIISEEGILDNSSGASAGFIPWTDILEIKETQVYNQKFINIIVKNPQDYLDRQTNAFKKKAMEVNYKSYGTLIGISANALQYDYVALKALLEIKLKEVSL